MKALVIVNPPAADGEKRAFLDAVSRPFTAAGIEYEVYETRKEDRLGEIVRRRLRDGFDLVVAAGGDGTVSGVSDGLTGSPIPLGIIPIGTGNLIARELGIPDSVAAAVELIAGTPCRRRIDAMRVGKRAYFLNASVGITAAVIGETTRKSKGRFGRIAYLATAIAKVLSSRPRYLVVEVDGLAHPVRAVEVTIMNCGLLANSFYPKGPDIRIDDGHLGVWILSMKSTWEYLRYAIGVMAASAAHPEAHFIQATKTVRIRSNRPLPMQADGDIIGKTPLEVEVLPGALTVLVPEPTSPTPRAPPP